MSQQGPGHHTRAQDKGRPHQVSGQPTFQVSHKILSCADRILREGVDIGL